MKKLLMLLVMLCCLIPTFAQGVEQQTNISLRQSGYVVVRKYEASIYITSPGGRFKIVYNVKATLLRQINGTTLWDVEYRFNPALTLKQPAYSEWCIGRVQAENINLAMDKIEKYILTNTPATAIQLDYIKFLGYE